MPGLKALVLAEDKDRFIPGALVYLRVRTTDMQMVLTPIKEEADQNVPYSIGKVEKGESGVCIVLNKAGEKVLSAG